MKIVKTSRGQVRLGEGEMQLMNAPQRARRAGLKWWDVNVTDNVKFPFHVMLEEAVYEEQHDRVRLQDGRSFDVQEWYVKAGSPK